MSGWGSGRRGSVMVRVLAEGLPRVALLLGVPSVKVIVLLAPGSESSVPVMVPLVWPSGMSSGLAVTPL